MLCAQADVIKIDEATAKRCWNFEAVLPPVFCFLHPS